MIWLNRCGALIRFFLTAGISLYQIFLSPFLGSNCRHLPTCSQYAKDALKTYGLLRGSYFTLKRILRCHPWSEPMLDPVPSPAEKPANINKFRG